MNNAINAILKHIYFRIPQQILLEAFRPQLAQSNRTLDAVIKEAIIVDFVLFNCNLYAGKTKKIVLEDRFVKPVDDRLMYTSIIGSYGVYAIPPEMRENRPLTAVLDISYPTTMAFYGSFPNLGVSGLSVANRADEALASFTRQPAYTTPTPILVDGDRGIIELSPPSTVHIDWILSCLIAYDNNFTNISPNVLLSIKTMAEHAAKAYIYNELYVKINQGFLVGGSQLEAIRSIVESYSDSYEKFEEALMKFRGASNFSMNEFRGLLSLML